MKDIARKYTATAELVGMLGTWRNGGADSVSLSALSPVSDCTLGELIDAAQTESDALADALAACKATYEMADRLLDMLHDDKSPDFGALADEIRQAFADIHCTAQPVIAKVRP